MDGSPQWCVSPTTILAPTCRNGGHPPHHSMTSSARARIPNGIVRPSASAVLRLMTNWVLGSLLDRKIGRFSTLEDLIYVGGSAPNEIDVIRPVAHEATGHDALSYVEHRW